MQNEIFCDKIFYHIYPLGMAGCPRHNDFSCPAGNVFQTLESQLDAIKDLGVNALYIGPIFESTAHGYDTVDYYHVDRRLGNNESFKHFCALAHEKGFAIILDAVFNHTGRDFFAFKDIQKNGGASHFRDWYLNLDFSKKSNYGDCFDYDGWAGCKDLVKLNTQNTDVRNHIKGAVKFWIQEFQIDGLRLDAADVLNKDFLSDLSAFCKTLKRDFWLMGEVVHGNYNDWANPNCIDSVTNYQIYKALWSSLNDKNFFELSWNLEREFGTNGIYNYSALYNFVDNHDVNRIASTLTDISNLHLIYGLLFTIPGIPSVYYHSENAIRGKRGTTDDFDLRPCVPPFTPSYSENLKPQTDSNTLRNSIKRFATIRQNEAAITKGNFQNVCTTNTTYTFSRTYNGQKILVLLNSAGYEQKITLKAQGGNYTDLLSGQQFSLSNCTDISVPKNWLRILKQN